MYRVWYVRPDNSYWTEWLPRPEKIRLRVLERKLKDPSTSKVEWLKVFGEIVHLQVIVANLEYATEKPKKYQRVEKEEMPANDMPSSTKESPTSNAASSTEEKQASAEEMPASTDEVPASTKVTAAANAEESPTTEIEASLPRAPDATAGSSPTEMPPDSAEPSPTSNEASAECMPASARDMEMPASAKEIPARITEEMPASANSNPAAAKPATAVDWEDPEARRRLQRISANFYKDKLVHVPKIQR